MYIEKLGRQQNDFQLLMKVFSKDESFKILEYVLDKERSTSGMIENLEIPEQSFYPALKSLMGLGLLEKRVSQDGYRNTFYKASKFGEEVYKGIIHISKAVNSHYVKPQ